jgi:uncharacterized membrane protein YjdF
MSKLKLRLVLSLYAIIMIIFARYAYITEAFTWLWDCVITFLIGVVVYKFRGRLRLTPLLFFVLMFALGLHTAGVYGLYTKVFFGLDFDHYTHFIGSFAMSVILVNWLWYYKSLKNKLATVCFIAILMTIGISAIHEIIEFLGYFYLGPGEGFLFAGAGDGLPGVTNVYTAADIGVSGTYSNAIVDIVYNAVGATAGCVMMGLKKLFN